jgi:hypothetical protein
MLKLIGNIKATVRSGEVSRPEYKIINPSKDVSITYQDRDSVLIIEKRATNLSVSGNGNNIVIGTNTGVIGSGIQNGSRIFINGQEVTGQTQDTTLEVEVILPKKDVCIHTSASAKAKLSLSEDVSYVELDAYSASSIKVGGSGVIQRLWLQASSASEIKFDSGLQILKVSSLVCHSASSIKIEGTVEECVSCECQSASNVKLEACNLIGQVRAFSASGVKAPGSKCGNVSKDFTSSYKN